MKKLVFAVQVFGLVAAFPLYVVVEVNHGEKALPANNSNSVAIEKLKEKNIQSVINSTKENENTFFFIGTKDLLLK